MTAWVLERFGVDAAQWRALLLAYLRMDLRAGSRPTAPGGQKRRIAGGIPYAGLLVLTAVGSLMSTIIAGRIPEILVGATFVATYSAMTTGMLVLLEFTAFVVSPVDYMVLGPQPVSSRTYFAARLASVLAYVSMLSLVIGFFPALTLATWRGLGLAGFVSTIAAVLLASVAATVVVTNAYVLVLNVVHPHKVRRATATLQLACAAMFYGVFYLVNTGASAGLETLSFETSPWLWANPASWFAAWVPVATQQGAPRIYWLAAVLASAITAACVPLAAGRLSLDYARRLGELSAAGEPARARRKPDTAFPGFTSDERGAVGTLVRAQFRYDMRFRLSILGILPLIVFYVLLGLQDGALPDPFVPAVHRGAGVGAPLYMAIIFMPMTLHAALHFSESWRAAWIFFATPASAVRLVLAAKNFATIFFLGGYLLLLAAIWSFYYERLWHVAVHTAIVGMLAHLLLQGAVMVSPGLPFAAEPRRAEHSSRLFGLFFVGGLAAFLIAALLPFVYARPALTVSFFVILVATTIAMEVVLRRRVAAAMSQLEYA